jgi:hypothetical protein
MRSKYSWKFGQWWSRQHVRLALCLVWLIGCMGASALSAFSPLDDAWRHTLTMLESSYAVPSERVLMVAVDHAYLERRGPPPHPLDDLARAIEHVRPHAPLVLIYTEAGALWHGDLPASALCGDASVLYYGPARPEWLPASCEFILTPPHPPAFALFVPDSMGADDVLWRAVARRLSRKTSSPRPGFMTYSALPPVLAMQGLLNASQHDMWVGGRVVIVAPDAYRATYTLPSGLEATREHIRAHALATLLDDALLDMTPRELVWLCAMLALALAAIMSARRHMLREYLVLSLVWLLVSVVLMLGLLHFLPPFMPLIVGWGGVVILRLVPARMSDLRVDVRSRLLEVTRSVNADRAHLISREQVFWQESLQRAHALIEGASSSMIAELPEGSWWIVPRAYQRMSEGDIVERRRDIRREPYETPLQMRRGVVISRRFLEDEALDVILAPLSHGDRVLGFWMLATPAGSGRALLSSHGARIKQLAAQLAREIAWRRLEARQQIRAATATSGVDVLVDEALLTLEQLSLQKEVLEQIVDGAQVGLMLVSLLGEVVFSNDIMSLHVGGVLDEAMQQSGLEATLSQLYVGELEISEVISATLAGQLHAWELHMHDEERAARTLSLTLSPVRGANAEQVESVLITSHDVTQLTERDEQRAAMMRLFNARSVDAASTIQGYVEVLAQSTSLSKGERRVVDRLSKSVEQLDAQVQDMLGVLEIGEAQARTIPVNLRFAVGTFLRQRRAQQDHIEVSWPDEELLIVRAEPDALQKTLRLLFEELEEWRAEGTSVSIAVVRSAPHIILTLELGQSTLPQSLLREVTDEGQQDQYSPSIQRARALLEGMDATLELVESPTDSAQTALRARVIFSGVRVS